MFNKFVVVFLVAGSTAAPGYHGPSVHATSDVLKSSTPVFHIPAQSNTQISLKQRAKPVIKARYITPSVHHSYSLPTVQSGPVQIYKHEEEYHDHPKYEFSYGVEDHHTGDFHSQKEVRDGDKVQGEYSLHEADGSVRIVKYTADKHSGFNAVVSHIQPKKKL